MIKLQHQQQMQAKVQNFPLCFFYYFLSCNFGCKTLLLLSLVALLTNKYSSNHFYNTDVIEWDQERPSKRKAIIRLFSNKNFVPVCMTQPSTPKLGVRWIDFTLVKLLRTKCTEYAVFRYNTKKILLQKSDQMTKY